MKLLKTFDEAFTKLNKSIKLGSWHGQEEAKDDLKRIYKATRAYKYKTTGDCCKGDKIIFIKMIWAGSYSRYKKSHKLEKCEIIEGEIISESYGAEKQQHTFTILTKDKKKMRIKGRNLYAIGVWRKEWKDEKERDLVLDEKHKRGDIAREERDLRKSMNNFY